MLSAQGTTGMRESILASISGPSVLRKYIGTPFLFVNERVWNRLSPSIRTTRAMRRYGAFLHSLVKLRSARQQYHGTFFFRNRPELELIRALSNQRTKDSVLRVTVLACSNGAEIYSILWTIRSARPDLKIIAHAVDISSEVLEIGKNGLYSPEPNRLVGSPIFERMTEQEMQAMLDPENGRFRLKSWIREGINWQVGDAGDLGLAEILGGQDIVVANRFLCHMGSTDAERCLRNLARLVKPGGYLFVSGVDLDVRTKVALDSGWTPVLDLIEEMHNGDPSLTRDWPFRYWGLEPFDKRRNDWRVRYASVFQLGCEGRHVAASRPRRGDGHCDSSDDQEFVSIRLAT
jgi:chemotaxis methyl-accepting protein methylase